MMEGALELWSYGQMQSRTPSLLGSSVVKDKVADGRNRKIMYEDAARLDN